MFSLKKMAICKVKTVSIYQQNHTISLYTNTITLILLFTWLAADIFYRFNILKNSNRNGVEILFRVIFEFLRKFCRISFVFTARRFFIRNFFYWMQPTIPPNKLNTAKPCVYRVINKTKTIQIRSVIFKINQIQIVNKFMKSDYNI